MAFELKNVDFLTRKVVKTSQFAVGGVIPIAQDKPLKKVLEVAATSSAVSSESVDYNHNMRGKINIEMLYLTEQNEYETAKAEFAFDHTENVNTENVNQKVVIDEYAVEEQAASYVKLSFLVSSLVDGTTRQTLALLGGSETDYIEEHDELEHVSYLQGAKTTIELEDKVELDGGLEKVLGYEYAHKFGGATCGIDQVSISGEVIIKLYCKTEAGIVAVERALEYNREIASLGTCPEDIPKVFANVVKLDYVVDAAEKPSIALKVSIEADACTYRKQAEQIIKDMFATKKELQLTYDCVNYADYVGQKLLQDKVVYNHGLDAETQDVLFARVQSVNIAKMLMQNGNYIAEGVIRADILLNNAENNEVVTQTVNIPFATCQPLSLDGNIADYQVQAFVKGTNKHDGQVDFEFDVLFDVTLEKENFAQYVSSTKEVGEKEGKSSAITIYVAGENDTLFSVAKALSISPEKIEAQNQVVDGKFENGQRIFVYNQLSAEF